MTDKFAIDDLTIIPKPVDSKEVSPPISKSEVAISFSDPDEKSDFSNILFISDVKMPKLHLEEFETLKCYSDTLFTNRPLKSCFSVCKYLWFNISDSDARHYLQKNLKDCPYKVCLVYSHDKNAKWLSELKLFMQGNCSIISLKRLTKVDALSSDEMVQDLLSNILKLTKPTSKAVKILSALCCGSKKKV